MKGSLVVCEGLDAAGKTTTIKKFLENTKDNNFLYSKGMGSLTFIGKLARRFPSTFLFLLELIYIENRVIKPNLRKNKIILQDRYDFSILSHEKAGRIWNRIVEIMLKWFIVRPDALVYFKVDLDERISRLKQDFKNKYHQTLIKRPGLILLRENKYLHLYNLFNGFKTIINTTGLSVNASAIVFGSFLSKVLNERRLCLVS